MFRRESYDAPVAEFGPGIQTREVHLTAARVVAEWMKDLDFGALDEWRDFGGIRNEEDLVITSDGARRLGAAGPLHIDEVEALRAT